MTRQRLEVRITGRVQGVWFRASTREEARRRGLDGWVRNLPDGGVEAVFEGGEAALQEMLAWCRIGPPGARVDRVEERWSAATGLAGFTIVR
ncbi:MAG TPA: acylphosphatase [Candidatus Methanoperedens sp.]|nr:acylphosphatase [Candidatus Methanoperedens sp.]